MVNTTVTMRTPLLPNAVFDPFLKRSIGFESIFRELDSIASEGKRSDNYPPYNIIKDEDYYRIELSVAGFSEDELHVELVESTLTISGTHTNTKDDTQYVHKGIAARDFVRKFTLSADLIVLGADIVNGVLEVTLKLELPDEKKPRTIKIGDENFKSKKPKFLKG